MGRGESSKGCSKCCPGASSLKMLSNKGHMAKLFTPRAAAVPGGGRGGPLTCCSQCIHLGMRQSGLGVVPLSHHL
jgi:hypothetical protein